MLKRLIDRLRGGAGPRPSYAEARAALERQALPSKRAIAAREDVEPEFLYFLATDPDRGIRRAVARNAATPVHADALLADDPDEEVRAALAAKIARLAPALGREGATRLSALALKTLERLAADRVAAVRAAVAREIKDSLQAPPEIVRKLARDAEAIVAAPILEYSPLLSDEDLLEIVAAARASEILQAVAARKGLSRPVGAAIAATLDVPAIARLLANADADLAEKTIEELVERAEGTKAWHRPLVLRPLLSVRAIKRLSGFVALALVRQLQARADLTPEVADHLAKRVRDRLKSGEDDERERADRGQDSVEAAERAGALDDAYVVQAATDGRPERVAQALARLADAPEPAAAKILASRAPKAIAALVWRAGLGMRTAVAIQVHLLKLRPDELLPARGGFDFPLSPDEMAVQLGLFGLGPR